MRNESPERHRMAKEYIVGNVVERRPDGTLRVEYPSLRQLARRHGIGLSTLGRWSSSDRWIAQRKAARDALADREWSELAARTYAAGARS